MLQLGTLLTIVAVMVQSVGKVLYGTFIAEGLVQWFILVAISLTAAVFLVSVHMRMPRQGRGLMLLANVCTAVSFIGLFFALRHLPPAMFASIEIGMSLLVAIGISGVQGMAWPPLPRILACAGIIIGCVTLSWAEFFVAMGGTATTMIWGAIAAAMITGLTSALTATTCRKLAMLGWSSHEVLAHRFHLTIVAAATWLAMDLPAIEAPQMAELGSIAAIGAVGVLLPLFLFQVALRQVDELTVMICLAAQPMISFLIALPSPAYNWNAVTFVGVAIVTFFVGIDIMANRRLSAP